LKILLYGDLEHVDEAREVLFGQKARKMEKLPPTQETHQASTLSSWNMVQQ